MVNSILKNVQYPFQKPNSFVSKWGTDWSNEEVKFLKDNWLKMSASQIGIALGRDKNAIIGKAHRMGLARKRRGSQGKVL